MNRLEILNRWEQRNTNSTGQRLPDWLKWRVSKKFAKWTGIPLKRKAKLFWGDSMSVMYPEFVSTRIGRDGYFETDMTSMFIDVLRPGMVVYDVGAHFGYFSLLASALVGDSGHVFAFEPTDVTFEMLSENTAGRRNVSCRNAAAYRESGEISFVDQGVHGSSLNHIVASDAAPSTNGNADTQLTTVQAVTLDDFGNEHRFPDFVKIDAEGSEATVLEGMAQIIEDYHPGISLEMGDDICSRNGNQPCQRNLEFLMDHGYEVFDYRSCRAQSHEVRQNYVYDNLLFRHRSWQAESLEAA